VAVVFKAIEGRHQPLAHIAIQVQEQIPDAVALRVGTPPDLLVGERFDTGAQAGPGFSQHLVAGTLKKERGQFGVMGRHGE
jgi:hypothetical protein